MIVVGVDGSEQSRRAVGWAVAEGRRRKTPVRVVYAWHEPTPTGRNFIPPDLLDPEALQSRAQAIANSTLANVEASGDVEIETVAVEGPPVETLLAAARDAELLVVGSRGHNGFGELVLGSVGRQCAQHAPCPVVVIRC